MRISQEEIQKRFKQLPEALREAIFSAEATETLIAIGKKYGLGLDKVGDLSTETNLVMLGVTHPNEYISNLQKILGIERDVARNIAQEVNTQIFVTIREELKKLHNIKEEAPAPQSPAPIKPSIPPMPAQKPEIKQNAPSISDWDKEAPYASKDLSPMPTITRKPYTFSDLQKQPGEKSAGEKMTPPAPASNLPAKIETAPKLPTTETVAPPKPLTPQEKTPFITPLPEASSKAGEIKPQTLPDPTTEIPKMQSPFEAKINQPVFRQELSQSTKEEIPNTNKTAGTYPSKDADPYRQQIAPHETSLNTNQHITKNE